MNLTVSFQCGDDHSDFQSILETEHDIDDACECLDRWLLHLDRVMAEARDRVANQPQNVRGDIHRLPWQTKPTTESRTNEPTENASPLGR